MSTKVQILSDLKLNTDNAISSDKNYILKLELSNGTSQFVQVTENQANLLGIKCNDFEPCLIEGNTLNNSLGVQEANNTNISPSFVYKIIKPEDLNLKPGHLPRGRPRKRQTEKESPEPLKEFETVIKQVRTRSGRITKPPRHIEQDFKKIYITDSTKRDQEPKTIKCQPKIEPLLQLRHHSRKRKIPPQFRCPTCNKAYLGRIKMLTHLQKYPDHGPFPANGKEKHDSTWNFLILMTQKFQKGLRALRFCQELNVVLQNARVLAKLLFKPVQTGHISYFVDDDLARFFNISPGDYGFDESELNKDVILNKYLEKNYTEQAISSQTATKESKLKINTDKNSIHENEIKYENTNMVTKKEKTINPLNISNKSDIVETNMKVSNFHMMNETNVPIQNSLNINNDVHNVILPTENKQKEIDFLTPLNNDSLVSQNKSGFATEQQNNSPTPRNSNCLALVKYETNQKSNYHLNSQVINYENLNTNLINTYNPITNLNTMNVSYHSLNMDISTASHHIMNHKEEIILQQSQKQVPNMTLHSELLSHDVDELMLDTVDTGQVSNILDTSSNSDDIMNVDQFVNERFKKLTEPDMEIQNTSLHLELPPLDIFQFHTS